MNKERYTTYSFIQDLHENIDFLLGRHINQEDLSVVILKHNKSYITQKLNYSKKNPEYLLTEKEITNWIRNLKENNCISPKIDNIINKYRNHNDLPLRRLYILKNHPNLLIDYFQVIDNKEKAYWLGWIFAEGNIYKRKDNQYEFSVQIDVKDGILIKRFTESIGFNPKKVKCIKRIKYNQKGKKYISRVYRVRIKNFLFSKNIMSYEFPAGKKANIIRFPNLNSKKFDLSFLLGFYDGDGSIQHYKDGRIKEIKIFSNSRMFLEDVRSKFKLDYKIGDLRRTKKDGTMTITYKLNLGFSLYKNLIVNFDRSLPRKRDFIPVSQVERQLSGKYGRKRFKFTKEELKDLIPKYTLQQIADIHKKRYGITIHHTTIKYWHDKWLLLA